MTRTKDSYHAEGIRSPVGSVTITGRGNNIPAELYHPAGAGNGGAIVVTHGSDGMREPWAALIREYAADLAANGFTVLVPDYFASTGTPPGIGDFAELAANLHVWQQAIGDTLVYAARLPRMTASKTGLLGFSLGGHICLRLRGSAHVVVEFFAPELRQLGGLGSAAPTAPHVQIHHGTADLIAPVSDAHSIASALRREGSAVQAFSYDGAGHGFAGADPINATARRSSRDRTLSFFGQHLA
jgi:dienelactone hydrolase